MRTIYLVSCVSKKRTEPAAARDLYISNWFIKAKRYVEQFEQDWFILSALYGLIGSDEVIQPYNKTLNNMPIADRRAWSEKVIRQVQEVSYEVDQIVILAGERYREFIVEVLVDAGISVAIPMRGLRLGEQMRWLDEHTPNH
ncbi:DUF6884 domain-containing protein [Haliea sp. E17]|uniref:DUF6884 domain-containing protein n=1 Tax=Haliea sp. E17 TaxID=3401576 RepID=UPI003AAF37E4